MATDDLKARLLAEAVSCEEMHGLTGAPDLMREAVTHIAEVEARLSAAEGEAVRLREMIGRVIEVAEDDPDYALLEVINEVQAEMTLAALHANGFTLKGQTDAQQGD